MHENAVIHDDTSNYDDQDDSTNMKAQMIVFIISVNRRSI